MPRKRKTTQSSKTGCVTGNSAAASGHVLGSHKKQMTLPFTIMSGGKKTPVTSTSTPSKASAQQLLAKISPPDVLCNALRSFQQ